MNKETIKEYADLELQKSNIEARQAEIKLAFLDSLKKLEADKVESEFGSFRIVQRNSWKYSDKIKVLEDGVKEAKKAEETAGTATKEIKESLTFYPVKEKSKDSSTLQV